MTSAAVIVPLPGRAARSLCAPSRTNSSTLAVELESGASIVRWSDQVIASLLLKPANLHVMFKTDLTVGTRSEGGNSVPP
jgi:hypothetical protein